jgi:uncharacterized protein YndB with AHSA1/START domain
MRAALIMAALALVFAPFSARAAVASASSSAFVIEAETEVAASAEQVWRALGRLPRGWSSAHTYSGDASRLSFDMRAGGCWCERWASGQSVEHGRVVLVMENDGVRTLRIFAALGPLQGMGATGVLTYTVEPHPNGAKISMTYRVSGDPALSLDQVAPPVDQVMMEQFARLGRFSASGSPD